MVTAKLTLCLKNPAYAPGNGEYSTQHHVMELPVDPQFQIFDKVPVLLNSVPGVPTGTYITFEVRKRGWGNTPSGDIQAVYEASAFGVAQADGTV